MKAIILAIGDELISGQTVDTNSAYLSRRLAERGVETVEHRTVGDDKERIASAIAEAAGRVEIVVVSGGLGPTEDDLTRQAMADAMGCELQLNAECLADIEEFFRLRNRKMSPPNRAQAMIPTSAEPMRNKLGTAPGIAARIGAAQVFIVPGVPAEMKWMYDNCIAPRLPPGEGVILHHVVHTFGEGESDVGAKIADLMKRGSEPTVGTTVAAGMVSVRIISRGRTTEDARLQADLTVKTLYERLGNLIVGKGDATMPSAAGELLRKRGQTLATAESCTGGLIGEMVTSVSGSSDYYLGGFVTYSNRLKRDLLGVSEELLARHGAVSEQVAIAMAEGCRQKLGSDWAIGVTGIAGPAGGSAEKPVGLVYVALAGPEGTQVFRHVFPGARDMVRLRSALAAMNCLRLALLR
jgi:nicotinamide-nucleotide amidase